MDEFRVELFNQTLVYFPSQEVTGQVIISVKEPQKVSSIKVRMVGKGEVQFKSKIERQKVDNTASFRYGESETVVHKSTEKYMETEIVVFHGPSLDAGLHVFPFTIFLGPRLPPSYEGTQGFIRYYVKALFRRDWIQEYETKTMITMNGTLDLNMYESTSKPRIERATKTYCCLCCRTGPLSAVLQIEKTGFVPGESIFISAEIDNKTKKEMRNSEIRLLEDATYISGHKSMTMSRQVAQVSKGRIGPGETEIWDCVPLVIPPLPPTNLGGFCGIIRLQYILSLQINPAGLDSSLYVRLPITIGTIPLGVTVERIAGPTALAGLHVDFATGPTQFPAQMKGLDQPFDGLSTKPTLPQEFNNYQNIPLPSFADSVWGEVDAKEDHDEEIIFVPKYLTYALNQPSI